MYYKLEEITKYFVDRLKEYDKDFVKDNWDDLHYHIFYTNNYIIGRYQATKWLGEEVFNVIGYIQDYEQHNFGKVSTNLSEPEHVVDTYVYLAGQFVLDIFYSIYGVFDQEGYFWMSEKCDPHNIDFNHLLEKSLSIIEAERFVS